MIGIVYINESYIEEEKYMKLKGIPTIRIEWDSYKSNHKGISVLFDSAIIRGAKLKNDKYKVLYNFLYELGISPISKPETFEINNSTELNSPLFGDRAPSVTVFNYNLSNEEIYNALNKANLKLPLFSRTDIESAAKYVGVEGCIINELSLKNVNIVLDNIRNNINNFNKIIFKQVIPILKTSDNKTIEYRGIVVAGKLLCFDYSVDSSLPNPSNYSLNDLGQNIITSAYNNGMTGAYLVDFGIKETGDLFVVECKDLMNGTIKNLDLFAEGLSCKQ